MSIEVTFWSTIVVVETDRDGRIALAHDEALELAERIQAWLSTPIDPRPEIEGAAI